MVGRHSKMSWTTVITDHVILVSHLQKQTFYLLSVAVTLSLQWLELCSVELRGCWLFTVECVHYDSVLATSWSDLKPVICDSLIQSNTGTWWELLRRLPPTGVQSHWHPVCVTSVTVSLFFFPFTLVKNFHFLIRGCLMALLFGNQSFLDGRRSV